MQFTIGRWSLQCNFPEYIPLPCGSLQTFYFNLCCTSAYLRSTSVRYCTSEWSSKHSTSEVPIDTINLIFCRRSNERTAKCLAFSLPLLALVPVVSCISTMRSASIVFQSTDFLSGDTIANGKFSALKNYAHQSTLAPCILKSSQECIFLLIASKVFNKGNRIVFGRLISVDQFF